MVLVCLSDIDRRIWSAATEQKSINDINTLNSHCEQSREVFYCRQWFRLGFLKRGVYATKYFGITGRNWPVEFQDCFALISCEHPVLIKLMWHVRLRLIITGMFSEDERRLKEHKSFLSIFFVLQTYFSELRCFKYTPATLTVAWGLANPIHQPMLAGGIPPTPSVKTANAIQTKPPHRDPPQVKAPQSAEKTPNAKADSFKHVFVAFWFPYFPVNTCQHECICSWVCVSAFKGGGVKCREQSQPRRSSLCSFFMWVMLQWQI